VSNLTLRSPAPLPSARHPIRLQPDARLFRSIAELVDVGIWVLDPAGITVFANRRMAALLGVDVLRLYSSRLWELLHLEESLSQQPKEHDVRLIRADGRASRLAVTITPWLVGDTRVGSIAMCAEVRGTEDAAVAPSRVQPIGWSTLSRREREVIEDIALGDRVPLIATRLYISQSTVRNHLSSAFRKLKVSDQQELVELLRRRDHRYIPEPAPGS
jgi:PAS domain S-box-containing protein